MTGSIDTMSLSDAKTDSASDQSRLASFGSDTNETTYIGVVRSEQSALRATVDELEQRLAPPEELFFHWLRTKKQLVNDGMLKTNAHNEALDRVNYFGRFEDHLNTMDAQAALTSIISRVESGEDIVLVCYCDDGKQCHRHPVAERIRARL